VRVVSVVAGVATGKHEWNAAAGQLPNVPPDARGFDTDACTVLMSLPAPSADIMVGGWGWIVIVRLTQSASASLLVSDDDRMGRLTFNSGRVARVEACDRIFASGQTRPSIADHSFCG
jgi:hypothetical protein